MGNLPFFLTGEDGFPLEIPFELWLEICIFACMRKVKIALFSTGILAILIGLKGSLCGLWFYSPSFVTREAGLKITLPPIPHKISTFQESSRAAPGKDSQKKKERKKKEGSKEPLSLDEEKMILVEAFDPSRKRRVLKASEVSGFAEFRNGELFLGDIVLHKGSYKSTEVLAIEGVRVSEHGYFEYEHSRHGKIQGIVTASQENIKIRFSNGPLAKSQLTFISSVKYAKLQEGAS